MNLQKQWNSRPFYLKGVQHGRRSSPKNDDNNNYCTMLLQQLVGDIIRKMNHRYN